MGNLSSKTVKIYEPLLNDSVDYSQILHRMELTIDGLQMTINALHDKNAKLELKISKLDKSIITITQDMEALLNNDKLLLDKLIEHNIISSKLE